MVSALSIFHYREPVMSNRLLFSPLLFALLLAPTTCIAAEPLTSKKLKLELKKIDEAYRSKKQIDNEKACVELLKKRDSKRWLEQVKKAKDDKRRKSFLCEYFAFSGDYELVPLKEFGTAPALTKKHRLRIIVFRPGKPIGDNEKLSDKVKSTTYLILKAHIPFGNENPYGVYTAQAFKGYSTAQIRRIVEAYRKEL